MGLDRQDEKRLLTQIKKIDRLNKKNTTMRVLKSTEVDILEDGSLDMADDVLVQLDLTVCSVHYKFDLPEQQQTDRIVRAIEHPSFTILGHATTRLINRREPMSVNMEKILMTLKSHNKIIEINAQLRRMDINETYCRLAKEIGVRMVISTDSHSIKQLDNMQYGVGIARRAWLEEKDVVNTCSFEKLLAYLKK